MTRLALVAAAALAGCSFSARSADPGATADGGPGSTTDGSPLVAHCHVHDTSLRLCLDFEDPMLAPIVRDGSSFAHDAVTTALLPMPRSGEQAAAFSIDSKASIPAAPDFAVMALTLEAWMKPDQVSSPSWALLASKHYGIGVTGGNVVCTVGDKIVTANAQPYAGQWVHIACTSDHAHLTLYINGSAAACGSGADVKGTADLGIGVGLTGGIDNVRLFAAVLPAGDVCTHAGLTGCTASCPSE